MRCAQGERRRGANGFIVDMGVGLGSRGGRSRRRGRGKTQELLLAAVAAGGGACTSRGGRPGTIDPVLRRYVMRKGTMGPVGCGVWRHPLHAPAAGACAGGTWQLAGPGMEGRGKSCSRGDLNDSQCQPRTCGINLEPMQCRVRGRQSLEWEATSRRAAYREPNPCGRLSREQGGRSRELAAHT